MTLRHRLLSVCLGLLFLPLSACAQDPPRPAANLPSAEEVQDLLRREPITSESWPVWRRRLLDWIVDRSRQTDAAFDAVRAFFRTQATPAGDLPAPFAKDALAWYFLGSEAIYRARDSEPNSDDLERAEKALRQSLRLDAKFARAHRNLAIVLMMASTPTKDRMAEANRALDEARRLDPTLPLAAVRARQAMRQERFREAENLLEEAIREEPENATPFRRGQAIAIVMNQNRGGQRATAVQALLDRDPEDGPLLVLHGVALAIDGDPRAGQRAFDRARRLGTDPTTVVPPQLVARIEEEAAPTPLEWALYVGLGFLALYAAVMLLMAGGGLILATLTRGNRVLRLLGGTGEDMVVAGQVARTQRESLLAKLYALALVGGLLLFYAAIPFLVVGLLAGTLGLLYLIFMLGRIPAKLVIIVVIAGLGGAWAIVRSLFVRPASGAFGLPKSAADCPRLYETLAEVAGRVETHPVDEVYLGPGAAISVHQEGRGPFGLFGAKRRVLTLGLSTLHFLTRGELKAILAHEYAHFSHKDTFYSRFIYQVSLSVGEALRGMAATGGNLSYVNPFYWFLFLYYKCYSLLSSGYSRSREFLADRMAATLYGSDVFAVALAKVCTDGTLFEMTAYNNISNLLSEGKSFVNVHEAFRSYRDTQMKGEEREELYQKLLDEKGSLFASHPTFGERAAAVAPLPRADRPDESPALSLFDDVEALEKELTEFVTGYVHYTRQASQPAG